MIFEPVAIVGQGCVLPGALSPDALWSLVREKRSALRHVPEGLWRIAPGADRAQLAREIASDIGGYPEGFDAVFDPAGFHVDSASLAGLDPVFLWTLHAAREALRSAGMDPLALRPRGAVVIGNLSYPTPGLVNLALETWAGARRKVDPRNRFMSGMPAHVVASALGFGGGAYAVDAACASSLYAIKLACDRLHDGAADIAIAGGVNHADDLFLHGGFSALHALSPTGQSRPFHREADGLVPAQGAAVLVLERLDDAIAAGRTVLGVIRGVGLSNDGRSRGLMVPAEEGQIRALRAAYAVSGLSPRDISLVECHATGTVVGDGAEVRSMREVFAGVRELPIGSLKSNVGHLITASGGAGIIKVLAAMREGIRPPTLHSDAAIDELGDGAFRLLHTEEPWHCDGPRRAAVSNFGFGGNNAHVILEQFTPRATHAPTRTAARAMADDEIAVIAQSVRTGSQDFAKTLFTTPPVGTSASSAAASEVDIDAAGLRFPPTDLKAALPQQLLLLSAAQEIGATLERLPRDRTSLLVGMQCDAEVARHAIRWCGDRSWVATLPEALRNEPLTAASVVGCMPNIVANRLSHQFDVRGPSFTVSSEELSGTVALDLALRALRAGEIDAAVVGAVDLACEPVQESAGRAVLPAARRSAGDAAVLMVLKRRADAVRDGDEVLAIFTATQPADAPGLTLALHDGEAGLTPSFGHAHAASGLLHVAAAVSACASRALPSRAGPMPWLPASRERHAHVHVSTVEGQSTTTDLRTASASRAAPVLLGPAPRLGVFAADTMDGLVRALGQRDATGHGSFRVAIVGETDTEYQQRVDRAVTLLRTHRDTRTVTIDDGIYFGAGPMAGELSFVFTGAAGAYAHMGRDLALAFPDLVDRFAARAGSLRDAASWVYSDDPDLQTTPSEKLWGASYLCQLHAEFTRGMLDLKPTAAIGYCSGETNSLFALDAWSDLDGFRRDVDASRVYDRELCGELLCVGRAWNLPAETPPSWSTWRVRAPVAQVRAAIASEPRAHLVIINSPTDVVIAGDPDGCARVAAVFGRKAVRTTGYDFVMHCPEAHEFRSQWRALHHRPTSPVPGVRFYTHATRSSYAPDIESVADSLTGQAMNTVDFPALVEQAYADGVRVFIEHGPHAGCTKWIGDVLGEREHLAVALDRYGHSSLFQALEGVARLVAAGVPADHRAVTDRLAPAPARETARAAEPRRSLRLRLPAHPEHVPPMTAPIAPMTSSDDGAEWMAPPPSLAPVGGLAPVFPVASVRAASPAQTPPPVAIETIGVDSRPREGHVATYVDHLAARHEQLAELHRAFVRQQVEIQSQFVQMTLAPLSGWAARVGGAPGAIHSATPPPLTARAAHEYPPPNWGRGAERLADQRGGDAHAPEARIEPAARIEPVTSVHPVAPALSTAPAGAGVVTKVAPPRAPTGPRFDRKQLEVHASGAISTIFGERFKQQDGFARQVRMPEPPLLLADRVLGIEGPPGDLGLGTIWTETDVTPDAWYLHEGRMPAGVMVESGQADLMLISWLGADFLNKGERVYRLLGCELRSHGELPRPGDTLHYQILVDGHAEQDGVRLFFFHYDCWVNGELRMSVRSGQAGFFTNEELADSAGVLWSAQTAKPRADAQLDPPVAICRRERFSAADVTALIEGRLTDCFGPGFERADTHTRTPTIAGGRMRLLDEVTHFDVAGGPWKRGYLRATLALSPDHWFFKGHFKNDPCMPGTLMLEGGLQAMQIHMTAMGFTLHHDGSRFEPVPEQTYSLRCRGQATPVSKEVVYEIFVEEIIAGPEPTIFADILGTVDGRKAFHCKRMGLRIVPAWPLDPGRLKVDIVPDNRPVAVVNGFKFDYASLLACAWGIPSSAFGPMYKRFDGTRRVARLPGPPYHFMSRVPRVEGPIGGMEVGSVADIDYDVPPGEWYFEQNNARTMPFAVLLETALQPCGWLASYVGGALGSEDDLFFRNLDGTGTQHREVGEDIGTLTVTTKLTSVSMADAIVIMGFDVVMRAGAEKVYTLKTVFGFFPGDTMRNQAGLPTTDVQRAALVEANDFRVELATRPGRYFDGTLRLASERLVMIDRISGLWRDGGKAGLGRLRAEKDVAAKQWFFKAHFYQDPVQPGSLGIEAMLQAVQALAIDLDLARSAERPRFETQAVDVTMSWKYRGQVIPENHVVVVDVEITEVRRDERGVLAVAEGSLWVDGKRIYEARGLGVRIVSIPGT